MSRSYEPFINLNLLSTNPFFETYLFGLWHLSVLQLLSFPNLCGL